MSKVNRMLRTLRKLVATLGVLLCVAFSFTPDQGIETRLGRVASLAQLTTRGEVWSTPLLSPLAAAQVALTLDATLGELETKLGTRLDKSLRIILTSRAEYYGVLQVVLNSDQASKRRSAQATQGVTNAMLPWAVVVCPSVCGNDPILRHEIAHVLMYDALGFWHATQIPAWFHEGVAELLEDKASNSDTARLSALRVQALGQQAALPHLGNLHDQGHWNNSQSTDRYVVARHAVELYLRDAGNRTLPEVMSALRKGVTLQDLTLRWLGTKLDTFEASLASRLGAGATSEPLLEVYSAPSATSGEARSRVIVSGLTPGEPFRLERYYLHSASASWEKADPLGIFQELRSTSASAPWGLRIVRKSGQMQAAANPAHCLPMQFLPQLVCDLKTAPVSVQAATVGGWGNFLIVR